MADRYWVGGGSSTNWNATGNTNWSASSGGANNASVPTTGDRVFFDASSGSGACVMNASVSLIGFDANDFTGTLTHNTSITITISAASTTAIRLPATGTYTANSATALFTITATSGTVDITSNGKRFGGLTINGAGHTTRILDALRVDRFSTSTLTLTSNTFNANNFDVTLALFASSNSTTRTITMGSGTWTLGLLAAAGATIWNVSTITNLTFNKNTANIVINSNSLSGLRSFAGGGLTYNGLTIDSNSARGVIVMSGGNTFASLAVGAGNTMVWNTAVTHTITAAPTISGTASLPISFRSGVVGTATTISCPSGTFALSWGAIRDITGSGGASFAATNALDDGNNTGWSIAPPADASVAIPTASEIATAVWDEPTAGNVTAGTFGAQLKTVVDAIDAKIDTIDTTADAIKAKTDSLAFTVAGQVDANVQYVNDVQVTGVGSEADPWGP